MPQNVVGGVVNAVPCPHCGRRNNMKPIMEFDQVLEPGTVVDCDHCKRKALVVKVDKRPRVFLRAAK